MESAVCQLYCCFRATRPAYVKACLSGAFVFVPNYCLSDFPCSPFTRPFNMENGKRRHPLRQPTGASKENREVGSKKIGCPAVRQRTPVFNGAGTQPLMLYTFSENLGSSKEELPGWLVKRALHILQDQGFSIGASLS